MFTGDGRIVVITVHLFEIICLCVLRFIVDIYDEKRHAFQTGLRGARFISLLIDGAKDSANLEDEIMFLKYFDQEHSALPQHTECTTYRLHTCRYRYAALIGKYSTPLL